MGLWKVFSLGENELVITWVVLILFITWCWSFPGHTPHQMPKTPLKAASGEEFSIHESNKCLPTTPTRLKPNVRSYLVPNLCEEQVWWAGEEEGEVCPS